MIGFGDLHRYAILKQREDSVFLWLQSVDDGALAFPIVLPWVFYWDYEVQLSDEDMRAARRRASRPDLDLLRRPRDRRTCARRRSTCSRRSW